MSNSLGASNATAIECTVTSGRKSNGSRVTVTDGSYNPAWFTEAARQLLPERDAGLYLCTHTGISESTCYRAVRGDSPPSDYMLHRLIWRADGRTWLNAFMEGCNEQWWADLQRLDAENQRLRQRLQNIRQVFSE